MAITVDEYHGQGGTYLLDPKTGKRTLVEQQAAPAPTPIKSEVTSDATPLKKAADSVED